MCHHKPWGPQMLLSWWFLNVFVLHRRLRGQSWALHFKSLLKNTLSVILLSYLFPDICFIGWNLLVSRNLSHTHTLYYCKDILSCYHSNMAKCMATEENLIEKADSTKLFISFWDYCQSWWFHAMKFKIKLQYYISTKPTKYNIYDICGSPYNISPQWHESSSLTQVN